MRLTVDIKRTIDRSALCWLATASTNGAPNVSPKELFACLGSSQIIVANVASPQTERNIIENNSVCISFIDMVTNQGYQIKGKAHIINNSMTEFVHMEKVLLNSPKKYLPFTSITQINIEVCKPIMAPRYALCAESSEYHQIQSVHQRKSLSEGVRKPSIANTPTSHTVG